MTVYEELIDLKYRQGVSTIKLIKRFPRHRRHVNEIALLGVPEKTLRKVVHEKKLLSRLMDIKKRFLLKSKLAAAARAEKSWFTRLCSSLCPWA
jgi:hypothetical protein